MTDIFTPDVDHLVSPGTLTEAMEVACHRWRARVALSENGRQVTYEDVWASATSLAAEYVRLGVGRGDRILCQLPNSAEFIIATVAAWIAGAVHVGADHELTAPELAWIVEHTSAAIVIMAGEPPERASAVAGAVRDGATRSPVIILKGGAGQAGCFQMTEMLAGAATEDADTAAQPTRSACEDAAFILVTSGTTGQPKTPLGYHGPFAKGWQELVGVYGFTPDDVHLGHLPLSHGFGLSMAMMALLSGGRLVLMERFSAREALKLVAQERVTVLNGTPSHFMILTERLDPAVHDMSSLRIGVGTAAAFPRPLLRRIYGDIGMDLILLYGSSEGAAVMTGDREDILRGAVGRPDPGYVRIVGRDHRPRAVGEVGEIAFCREYWTVEYWQGSPPDHGTARGAAALAGRPSAEADGDARWYYTGDIGRIDEEGRLYVLGRLKHQIDRGGIKVDPGEVEAALLTLPDIEDVAVIGRPDPVLGQRVCACVVAVPGAVPELTNVRRRLAPVLASYKLPEELCSFDELPRTAIGKVDREQLTQDVEHRSASVQRHGR